MKADIVSYIPFFHDNLDYKQKIIEIARSQDLTQIQGSLTSILIYVNTIDYIASHLLENLRTINYLVTQFELSSVVFYNGESKSKGMPLGPLVEELQKYEFPDKREFLQDLIDFNKLRIKYIHNFAKLTPKELETSDIELSEIRTLAERVINRYDTLVRGIIEQWNTYKSKIAQRYIQQTPAQMPLPIPETPAPTTDVPTTETPRIPEGVNSPPKKKHSSKKVIHTNRKKH